MDEMKTEYSAEERVDRISDAMTSGVIALKQALNMIDVLACSADLTGSQELKAMLGKAGRRELGQRLYGVSRYQEILANPMTAMICMIESQGHFINCSRLLAI